MSSKPTSHTPTLVLTEPTIQTTDEPEANTAGNDPGPPSDQPEPRHNKKPEMKVRRLGAKFVTNPRGLAELLRELYPDGNWEVDIEHNIFTIKTPDVLPLLLIQERCQR